MAILNATIKVIFSQQEVGNVLRTRKGEVGDKVKEVILGQG